MCANTTPITRDGFSAGSAWADCCAKPDQLQRLAIFRHRLNKSRSRTWSSFFTGNGCCTYSVAELVAFEILGTDHLISRSDASAFWERVLGEHVGKVQEGLFLRGFAEGAIAHAQVD